MTGLPLGMTEGQSYELVVEGVRQFAGHQVVSFEDAWRIATGTEPTDLDHEEERLVRWLLEELGYEANWVTELGRSKWLRKWVRGPWPIDFRANERRPIEAYVLH